MCPPSLGLAYCCLYGQSGDTYSSPHSSDVPRVLWRVRKIPASPFPTDVVRYFPVAKNMHSGVIYISSVLFGTSYFSSLILRYLTFKMRKVNCFCLIKVLQRQNETVQENSSIQAHSCCSDKGHYN